MSVAGDGHARVIPVSQQAAGDKEGCRERLNERVAGGREKRERERAIHIHIEIQRQAVNSLSGVMACMPG